MWMVCKVKEEIMAHKDLRGHLDRLERLGHLDQWDRGVMLEMRAQRDDLVKRGRRATSDRLDPWETLVPLAREEHLESKEWKESWGHPDLSVNLV